jgi:CSLREA domain-containing protein
LEHAGGRLYVFDVTVAYNQADGGAGDPGAAGGAAGLGGHGGTGVLAPNGDNGPNGVAGSSAGSGTAGACSGGGLSAGSGDGGLVDPNEVSLSNTIVARNTAAGAASDVSGSVDPGNSYFNLIGTGGAGGLTDGPANLVGVTDPHLGTLASNGAPTQTIALLGYSPAINAGDVYNAFDPTNYQPLSTDQRGTGYARIQGDNLDIGAYESPYNESLVVTTLADEDDGTSDLTFGTGTSLREAITWANAHPGADTITFDPALAGGVITLGGTELPVITDDLTIQGLGASALTISGDHASRVLEIAAGTDVKLSGVSIINGKSTNDGGGVFNAGTLTVTDSSLSGNSAVTGGGIYTNGTLGLINCTVSGNSASGNWSGNPSDQTTGSGGGLFNDNGTLTLTNCTVSGNSANASIPLGTTGGFAAVGCGGGLENWEGTLTLTNCTVSGNSTSAFGGGVNNNGTLTLTNCTVSGNSANSSGGGGLNNPGTATLINTIVAGNPVGGDNNTGALTAASSHNLIGGNPLLAPLGNYGGPTMTMPLLPGSPAIDAGTPYAGNSGPEIPTTDQRRETRAGGGTDIGAFESQGFTLTADPSSTPQSTAIGAAFANPLSVTVKARFAVEPVNGGVVRFDVTPAANGAGALLPDANSASGYSTSVLVTIARGVGWGTATIAAVANSVVGSYSVTASASGALGYRDAPVESFAMTNTRATPSFSKLSAPTITYGAATTSIAGKLGTGAPFPTGSVTITLGGVPQTATLNSDGSFAASFDTHALAVTAGGYPISFAYAGDSSYVSATGSSTLTVTPATLTVTANPQTKVSGSADPALTYAASGLQLTDTAAKVLSGRLTRDVGEAVGSYLIHQGTLTANGNYTLTFVGSVLYITSAATSLTGGQSVAVSSTGGPVTASAPGSSAGAPQLTATASGFDGLLTAAQLTASPVSGFSAAGTFFDVNVASCDLGAASTVQLVFKNLTPLAPLYWASATGWAPVQDASGNKVVADGSGAATVTLTLATSPSLANLHGTYLLGGLPQLSASGVNVSATAGAPFSGPVATFTNTLASGSAASYTAVITWGDGNTSAGVISGTGSTLTVSGSHTYADPVNEAVSVQISHVLGYTTTATVSDTATVTSLGQGVASGLTGGIGFWNNKNGQALLNSFNVTPSNLNPTALSAWLSANFPNLYGAGAGANNLTGYSNAQVAAYFQKLFALGGTHVQAQVLAVALNVYATTSSLGGSAGTAYGFIVSAAGLGARSYNLGTDGAAFGVANNTTLNVYELLVAVNKPTKSGVLYSGNATLQVQCADLFNTLNTAGNIG